MNREVGARWLQEVSRLLQPGGLALISVSSCYVLEMHRKHKELSVIWKDVRDEDLKREGSAFRTRDYSMMKEPYGEIVYDLEWLTQNGQRPSRLRSLVRIAFNLIQIGGNPRPVQAGNIAVALNRVNPIERNTL